MEITEYTSYCEAEILPLYTAVGWTAYTDRPETLKNAFSHSLKILAAYDGQRLTGIIRSLGDGYALLIQDILVLPEYQRHGIGTALMRAMLDACPEARQCFLLTDDTEKTKAFYRSLGFNPAAECGCAAFLQFH